MAKRKGARWGHPLLVVMRGCNGLRLFGRDGTPRGKSYYISESFL